MVTIIVALVTLVLGGLAGYFIFRYVIKGKYNEMIDAANKEAEVVKEKKLLEVKEKFLNKKAELEKEVQQRNSRIQQSENKLKQREISLNQRQEDLGRRKMELDQNQQRIDAMGERLDALENVPADRWNKVVDYALTCVLGIAIGFMASQIGL